MTDAYIGAGRAPATQAPNDGLRRESGAVHRGRPLTPLRPRGVRRPRGRVFLSNRRQLQADSPRHKTHSSLRKGYGLVSVCYYRHRKQGLRERVTLRTDPSRRERGERLRLIRGRAGRRLTASRGGLMNRGSCHTASPSNISHKNPARRAGAPSRGGRSGSATGSASSTAPTGAAVRGRRRRRSANGPRERRMAEVRPPAPGARGDLVILMGRFPTFSRSSIGRGPFLHSTAIWRPATGSPASGTSASRGGRKPAASRGRSCRRPVSCGASAAFSPVTGSRRRPRGGPLTRRALGG